MTFLMSLPEGACTDAPYEGQSYCWTFEDHQDIEEESPEGSQPGEMKPFTEEIFWNTHVNELIQKKRKALKTNLNQKLCQEHPEETHF